MGAGCKVVLVAVVYIVEPTVVYVFVSYDDRLYTCVICLESYIEHIGF